MPQRKLTLKSCTQKYITEFWECYKGLTKRERGGGGTTLLWKRTSGTNHLKLHNIYTQADKRRKTIHQMSTFFFFFFGGKIFQLQSILIAV